MDRIFDHTMATSASVYVRRILLAASALLGGVGLFWIGRSFVVDGELKLGNPPRDNPHVVRAEVVRVQGAKGVRIGDKCEFFVTRHSDKNDGFLCNAQVTCNERLLYGGSMRGYVPCKLDSDGARTVVGKDAATTLEDQDGALYIDTAKGVLRVWDDEAGSLGAFNVEADILSVN
jgi:hypothetical protein